MGTLKRGLQQAGADTAALMGGLYLDLLNFNPVILLDQLNHAHPFALNFHYIYAAALPTCSDVSPMPVLIPRTPRRDDQLQVHRTSERIQPLLIFFCRRNETVLHECVTTYQVMRLTPRRSAAAPHNSCGMRAERAGRFPTPRRQQQRLVSDAASGTR